MEKTSVHRHVRGRNGALRAVDDGTPTFNQWFEAQFGPAPGRRTISELRIDLQNAQAIVGAHQRALIDAEAYEAKKDAAMKAWSARRTILDGRPR